MPTADHSTTCVRGKKTICIPCSQEQNEPIVDNPERFPQVAGSTDPSHARTLPAGDPRGYRMKDIYPSRKPTWKLRRIELRNGACYLVRPSFLMPYLTGRTEDVQGRLFFASSPSLPMNSP